MASPGRAPAAPAAAVLCARSRRRAPLSPAPRTAWLFGGHSPSIGLAPSSAVELVPLFPHVCPSTLSPPVSKSWIDKRMPNYKESGLFHSHEKTHFLANQHQGGCHDSLKPISRGPTITITAATAAAATAMVSVDPEELRGLTPSIMQPCHFLTLTPIRIPLRTTPFSDKGKEHSRAPRRPALMLRAPERKSLVGDKEDKEPPPILVRGEDTAAKGNKPVASTPVPGSPWCVVWTGDDRVFFFNPTMQLSVWEKPVDLQNRGDLKRIIEDPPHKRKLEASATESSDGSSSEDGSEDLSVKTKRNRTESCGSLGTEDTQKVDKGPQTPPPQILLPLEERVTHFRDMLLERGGSPQIHTVCHSWVCDLLDSHPQTSLKDPSQVVTTVECADLAELVVSAFSTWEKELHKIVFDPRYLLLNSEERKQVMLEPDLGEQGSREPQRTAGEHTSLFTLKIFEQFVKTRIKEEYKERKSKLLLAKEEFKKLLEESKVSPRTTFKEFAEKHGRDQRFRLVQKRKDQEHFFNQFILILKKRDKENRLRLRKMR
ncbi:Transcription elongation regulator 1-like protein [Apodemus speciosus]|uniref:Transcription elongation regulator 1-like protein n=1 Tax=Apodemus speciosus TaxID=105296 RepID=A0ABQ0F0N4_APOSI